MSKDKVVLNNVMELKGLNNLDFSDGFVCDMETGICGPEEEIQKAKQAKIGEEKKNANNNMV